jgi:tetraacyldisaccharide 4'-kinase
VEVEVEVGWGVGDVSEASGAQRAEVSRPYDLLRRIIGPIAGPLYGLAVARRNARFDAGIGVRRVGCPVISVGNLTVGGTGKTPLVQVVVEMLQGAGRRPAIAMRGYMSGATVSGESDEAREYRAALKGVAVLVGADRWATIRAAQASGVEFDCVVLDDGFQHRQLHRDVEIVLIDAQARTLTDRLLPWGDLREPARNVARADVVVWTHGDDTHPTAADAARLAKWLKPGAIVVRAAHVWSGFRVSDEGRGGGAERVVDVMPTGKTWVVCGIGRPARFLAEAAKHAEIVGSRVLADHDAFTPATCEGIAQAALRAGARQVLMTEKDWTKASSFAWPLAVVRPVLKMQVAGLEHMAKLVNSHMAT